MLSTEKVPIFALMLETTRVEKVETVPGVYPTKEETFSTENVPTFAIMLETARVEKVETVPGV